MANKETARKALEVIRAWTSLENPRASCRFLIAYAALAHIEDGTGFSEILYIRVSGPRDGKKTQTGAIAPDLVGEDHCVVVTAGTTSAVFFRMIDARHKLVVVDEADELPTGIAREIARIARAGYRTGAKVYRCDGPIGTKSYGVYGPKMFMASSPNVTPLYAIVWSSTGRSPQRKQSSGLPKETVMRLSVPCGLFSKPSASRSVPMSFRSITILTSCLKA